MTSQGKTGDLPIIAMSAWEDVGKSLTEAGACLFLEKPFDPYVLEKETEATRNDGLKNLPGCQTSSPVSLTVKPGHHRPPKQP